MIDAHPHAITATRHCCSVAAVRKTVAVICVVDQCRAGGEALPCDVIAVVVVLASRRRVGDNGRVAAHVD